MMRAMVRRERYLKLRESQEVRGRPHATASASSFCSIVCLEKELGNDWLAVQTAIVTKDAWWVA